MTRVSHRISTVIAALGMAALVMGCSSSSSSSSSSSGDPKGTAGLEKSNLTVAAVPAGDSAGLYVAQQQGYFTDVGLHVKIVPAVSSATAIANEMAGKYDVTAGNYVSYILADARQHANLRIIAEGSVMAPNVQEILTPAGSRITSISELRGTKIGVNVPDNIGTILVGTALEENGVPLSDVQLKAIPFPDMDTALKDHQINAAWLPEPFISAAEQQVGAQQLFDADQGATLNFPIEGYAVTQAWEQKYPRTAADFTRALERGQALADSNRADVEKAMETFAGVPSQTAAIMAMDNYPLGVDRIRLQRIADAMQRFGLLKTSFNIRQMIG